MTMSKYIKLEDALSVYRLKPIIKNGTTTGVRYPTPEETMNDLSELPTIEVSEDCISKAYLEHVIEIQAMPVKNNEEYLRGWNNALYKVVKLIEKAPSVVPTTEQSSKVGEWIYIDEPIMGNPYGRYRCSRCEMEKPHETDYCPNCGVKMKG